MAANPAALKANPATAYRTLSAMLCERLKNLRQNGHNHAAAQCPSYLDGHRQSLGRSLCVDVFVFQLALTFVQLLHLMPECFLSRCYLCKALFKHGNSRYRAGEFGDCRLDLLNVALKMLKFKAVLRVRCHLYFLLFWFCGSTTNSLKRRSVAFS
nr:MAG TPA: hypothetical protein [Caudoviricetes sp.]